MTTSGAAAGKSTISTATVANGNALATDTAKIPEKEGVSHQSTHEGFQAAHRRTIRTCELETILPYFPEHSTVLEVGAGAGWQAKVLAARGYDVHAIDIPSSNYNALRE